MAAAEANLAAQVTVVNRAVGMVCIPIAHAISMPCSNRALHDGQAVNVARWCLMLPLPDFRDSFQYIKQHQSGLTVGIAAAIAVPHTVCLAGHATHGRQCGRRQQCCCRPALLGGQPVLLRAICRSSADARLPSKCEQWTQRWPTTARSILPAHDNDMSSGSVDITMSRPQFYRHACRRWAMSLAGHLAPLACFRF
jgi:hypothetical protein